MPDHTCGLLGDPHLGEKKDRGLGLVIPKRAFKHLQLSSTELDSEKLFVPLPGHVRM